MATLFEDFTGHLSCSSIVSTGNWNRNMVPVAGTDTQHSILIPCTWRMSRKDCRAQRWESCQASLCILVSFVPVLQTYTSLESPNF